MKKKKVSFAMLLLAASALGVIAGYVVGEPIAVIKPLGTLFTRLLFMLVPGLVFFSIASSFANIADIRKLSKWAGKIIGWFMLTTVIGTVIGTATGLFFKPGQGITLPDASYEVTKVSAQNYIEWIPSNAFGALADGNIIQIVFFAIFAGIAIVLMKNESHKDFLKTMLNAGQDLFLTIIKYVMYYAPIGIFALMASSVAAFKGSLLSEMSSFLTAYTVAFVLHIILVYFVMFWAITKLNPFTFFKKALPALITAFATTSSAGTMPVSLQATKDMGVDEELADFGIPLGVTFNMDSMALEIPLYIMLGMYAIGANPTVPQILQFVLLGVLFSIGCAGVPGGGIAIAVILVNTFGLPVEIVGWIAAVFFYLDVTGTAINVWGDMISTTIAAKTEGMLDEKKYNSIAAVGDTNSKAA
ncbi:dicarboxylate/amino acid:cation symporter [Gottschalkiaceae bacterium SANA]|nr:dicarboxylate/amino acid:cation symporter [Gottschalkiaceae bacterium SANA]